MFDAEDPDLEEESLGGLGGITNPAGILDRGVTPSKSLSSRSLNPFLCPVRKALPCSESGKGILAVLLAKGCQSKKGHLLSLCLSLLQTLHVPDFTSEVL